MTETVQYLCAVLMCCLCLVLDCSMYVSTSFACRWEDIAIFLAMSNDSITGQCYIPWSKMQLRCLQGLETSIHTHGHMAAKFLSNSMQSCTSILVCNYCWECQTCQSSNCRQCVRIFALKLSLHYHVIACCYSTESQLLCCNHMVNVAS